MGTVRLTLAIGLRRSGSDASSCRECNKLVAVADRARKPIEPTLQSHTARVAQSVFWTHVEHIQRVPSFASEQHTRVSHREVKNIKQMMIKTISGAEALHFEPLARVAAQRQQLIGFIIGRAFTTSSRVSVCVSNATLYTSGIAVGSCAASYAVCRDTARKPAAPHASSSSAESAHMSNTRRSSVRLPLLLGLL